MCRPSTGQALLAAVVVALAFIGGIVGLELAHQSTDVLLNTGGPLVTGLLALVGVSWQNAPQNAVLAQIDKNTNGALDGRIKDGVRTVLESHGVLDVARAALTSTAASNAAAAVPAATVAVNVAPAPVAEVPAIPAQVTAPDVNGGGDVADPAQLPPVSSDVLPDPHAAAVSPDVLREALAQLVAQQQS